MNAKDNIFEAFLGKEVMMWLKQNCGNLEFGNNIEDYNEYALKPKARGAELVTFSKAPRQPYGDMSAKGESDRVTQEELLADKPFKSDFYEKI